jgi:hypothetical protein
MEMVASPNDEVLKYGKRGGYMNAQQSRIVTITAIAAAVMIIYPPWVELNARGQRMGAVGYSFISSPPFKTTVIDDPDIAAIYKRQVGVPHRDPISARVDLSRLLLQLVAAGIVGGADQC